jgi:hypothetical protein
MAVTRKKLEETRGTVNQRAVDQDGSPFSQEQWIYSTLLSQRKRLPRMICRERVCVVFIKFLLQDVHQFESMWLSDMGDRLSCGRQHIFNLLELMYGRFKFELQ